MKPEPIISVDWLQFFCDLSTFEVDEPYSYEVLDIHARVWSECGVISAFFRPILHVSRKPYSSVMSQSIGICKVDNAVLYMPNAVNVIQRALECCHIRILSITRVDLCGDFERIAGVYPAKAIENVLSGKWLRVGQSRFYGRGEDLWRLSGIRQVGQHCWAAENSFEFLGSANNASRFTYLRYGSRSSEVCTYLYNKSLELKQIHDKPYIRQLWEGASGDVWRLEFSIKGKHLTHIAREMRRGMPTGWEQYFDEDKRQEIYSALAAKYFDIRVNSGQVRKDREVRVQLWSGQPTTKWAKERPKSTPSGRSDRILLKKLANLYSEIYDLSAGDVVRSAFDVAREYAKLKDLAKWCEEHDVDITRAKESEVLQRFSEFKIEYPDNQ